MVKIVFHGRILEWEYVGNDGHMGNDDEGYGPMKA